MSEHLGSAHDCHWCTIASLQSKPMVLCILDAGHDCVMHSGNGLIGFEHTIARGAENGRRSPIES
jgi:hypothetical protein